MEDRCKECGLWNSPKTEKCPVCGSIMDFRIEGLSLSWKCRKCEYSLAATANKLCFWDNHKYPEESYSKMEICSYAER